MTVDATPEQLAAGRGYEALFVPAVFASWTGPVLDGAGVGPGDHVLDVACGTGILARHALARVGSGGCVAGVDSAPGMLAVAREIEPGIAWHLGPAEALPMADRSLDRVVSQFGMMFFQDVSLAVSEMFRVLKPGGRLSVAVWDDIAANPAYAALAALLDEEIGTEAGNATRIPFAMGDAGAVAALLASAGFDGIASKTQVQEARFPSLGSVVEAELRGWLPLFGITLDEPRIARLLGMAETRLAAHASVPGTGRFPTSAHVLTAHKPDGPHPG